MGWRSICYRYVSKPVCAWKHSPCASPTYHARLFLQSQKDGLEFQLVRESIVETFETLCDKVELEVDKSVLKQGSVQHLYGQDCRVAEGRSHGPGPRARASSDACRLRSA